MSTTRLPAWLLTVVFATDFTAMAAAHGGQYRGPGDAQPPVAGAKAQSNPARIGGPGAPTAGPTLPPAGAVPPPAAAAASPALRGAAGPAGAPVGEDPTRWGLWWGFRKDSFLGLRRAVHASPITELTDDYFMGGGEGIDSLRPTPEQIGDQIVPALHRLLAQAGQRDITSACLVALAKIGVDAPGWPLLPALRAHLASHDQEIRETAALALGISQRPAAVPDLIALLRDDAVGRELVGRETVDDRTRAFAAYGLGLVAWASNGAGVQATVLDELAPLAADTASPSMVVPIAALDAIGLLRLAGGDRAILRRRALALLARIADAGVGPGRQLVQAHVPGSAVRILAGEDDAAVRDAWTRRLVATLQHRGADGATLRNRAVGQSAALALGALAAPHEPGAADAWISRALIDAHAHGRDPQTSFFALMALGEIGGSSNREFLLDVLRDGSKALEKPWAALALGVLAHRRRESAASPAADDAIADAIAAQLDRVKNPDTVAAFAIGLGLAGAAPAAPKLRRLLAANGHQNELAGHLCIALALLGDRGASDQIGSVAASAARRPELLLQAATALGLLGDKRAALLLADRLGGEEQNVAVLAALAFAIGRIGDRRSVAPLLRLMEDPGRSDLARAFAAVALGGVADKEPEPWNAKIGRLVNYRAAVETLTNGSSGILDIL